MNGLKSDVTELYGLRDRREAHRAYGVWTLAYLGGTLETEEVMPTGNQGSDHLPIHTVDTDLLSSPCRYQPRPVGEGGLGRGGRGGRSGAFAGRREGRAVGGEPVGIKGSGRTKGPSVDALGLGVL